MLKWETMHSIAIGLVLGLIIHLSVIFALPSLVDITTADRVASLGVINTMKVLNAEQSRFFQPDPAFKAAICPFDLKEGALRVTTTKSNSYTVIAAYTLEGNAFTALNDRAIGRPLIDVMFATAEQRRDLQMLDDSDQIILTSPTLQGFVLIRMLKGYASQNEEIQQVLQEARCKTVPAE